jgi:hypothetical protein
MKHFAIAMAAALGMSTLAACDQKEPQIDLFAAQKSFDAADSNKDGVVSENEAGSVRNLDFAAADTDKNAALTPEEFTVAFAATTSSKPPG